MTPDEFLRATWPIAIVQSRYWGGWVAVPQADASAHDGVSPLDDGVWDDDVEAFDWKAANRERIGMGLTIEEAYADLRQRWGVR